MSLKNVKKTVKILYFIAHYCSANYDVHKCESRLLGKKQAWGLELFDSIGPS